MIWTDLDGPGMEHLKLTGDEEGYLADGMYVGRNGGGAPYRLHYEIRIGPSWQMRSLALNMVEGPEGAGKIALTVDENCNWRDGAGSSIPALEGCHEVDIFTTPFTNTLPIRRLGLAVGESAEISVAYIDGPGLELRPVRQRYQCIRLFGSESGLYSYEALFRAASAVEIEVDSEGLVIDYPNGFRRVWTE